MGTEMKEFDVVRICRSDGADTGPGYWPITPQGATQPVNPSKKAVADKAPRAKPQMTRLAEDDPRYTEWRVKLGILLKQELSPNPEEGNAWYVPFPRGYWLYEKSKHLWVSGYPIKSKLFKTPQEFALHLIWLLSASKDYKDCSCVHCNVPILPKTIQINEDSHVSTPTEPPAKLARPAKTEKPEKATPKITPVPLPQIPGQPPNNLSSPARPVQQLPKQVIQPIQKPSTAEQPKPIAPSAPAPAPAPAPALVPAPMPTQVPQAPQQPVSQTPVTQPQQQQTPQTVVWSLKSSILFRVGELVWYQNGNTWRLGVICAANAQQYELLPIGHGMVQRQNVAKTLKDLRPFYAFSVPGVAIPELKDKVYDDIQWEAMLQAVTNDPARRDLLALDASKMAASKIDCTFSLWTPQGEDANAKFTPYFGGFFGAERVELGDCLRLKSVPVDLKVQHEALILGLRYIFVVKNQPGVPHFRGHLYMLIKGDASSATPVPEENLPMALREECKWRNHVTPNSRWRCIIVKENIPIKESQIRGRFYPTHRLLPILNAQAFQAALQQGQTDSQMAQLNSRMDGAGRYIGQTTNRLETLGESVPHTARLALEPLVKETPSSGAPM